MFVIYRIKNLINNKVYIGSSTDVETRWRHHKHASFNENDHHYNYPLMKAFRKYGIDNFLFEIVETVDTIEEMIKRENAWIVKEDCVIPNGYNQTERTDSPMFDTNISQKMAETKRETYGKCVCEINNNNQIIGIWRSIVECAEDTGLDRYKISNVCNGSRLTTGGRKFRFYNDNTIVEPERKTNPTTNRITKNSKKVIKIDKDTNEIIQIYDSIQLASQDNNCDPSGIAKVCNNKRNTCGGYKWQYQK